MSSENNFNASKNSRVVYAYRKPVIHAMVLFCLYQQAKVLDKKYKNVTDEKDIPTYVRALREGKKWKQQYWEKMCDLKKKEEDKVSEKAVESD